MSNYLQPAVIFQQEFRQLAPPVNLAMPVCVVGPAKNVLLPGMADEDDLTYGAYDSTLDTDYEIKGLESGDVVDEDSVAVVFTEVYGKYATLSGTNVIEATSVANRIKLGAGVGSTLRLVEDSTHDRVAALGERDVRVGDRLKITCESDTIGGTTELWTTVSGFVQEQTAAVVEPYGDTLYGNDTSNKATVSASHTVAILVDDGTERVTGDITANVNYIGDIASSIFDETYTFVCTTGGDYGVAEFSYTSDEGESGTFTLPADGTTNIVVGTRGMEIRIANVGSGVGEHQDFVAGDSFTIAAVAAHTRYAVSVTTDDYTGSSDTVYEIKVVKGGRWADSPKVSVKTNNNTDSASAFVVEEATPFNLGTRGIQVQFDDDSNVQDGLVAGDVYRVVATAAVNDGPRTIVLRHPLPKYAENGDAINASGADLEVDFMVYKSSLPLPDENYPSGGDVNWTVDGSTVSVNDAINMIDSTVLDSQGDELPIPIVKANVRIHCTATSVSKANQLGSISSTDGISAILGAVNAANPAAYAVYKALLNSAGMPVYYVTTAGDTVDDYTLALKQAKRDTGIFAMVPTSQDSSIIELVKGHVASMSGENWGRERVAYFSEIVDENEDLYVLNDSDEAWTGYIALGDDNTNYTALTMPGATFVEDGVLAGDIVRCNFSVDALGNETYETHLVDSVVDEESLILATGPENAVGTNLLPERIEIIHPLTLQEIAEGAAAVSSAHGDRRIRNIYPDQFEDTDGELIPGYYVAAAVAGLKSSVVAHQPITNFEIAGFGGAPKIARFEPEQLNVIAAGGTMIIGQDVTNGPIYIRHQLTTDMADVNHQEITITDGVDAITRFLRSYIKPTIGKRNITQEYLLELETLVRQRLDFFALEYRTASAGSPISEVVDIVATQDPDIRTQVLMVIELRLPYPNNRVKVKIVIV